MHVRRMFLGECRIYEMNYAFMALIASIALGINEHRNILEVAWQTNIK